MKKLKLSRFAIFILLVIISSGTVVIFQNCSPNGSGSGAANTPISNLVPIEVNTTKAVNIRFYTALKTVSSTDTIEIVAYAEDENGDVVTDFNYSGLITTNSLVSICASATRFVNGELKTIVSVQNNSSWAQGLDLEVKSVVPTNMPLGLMVAAPDPYISINTVGNKPLPRTGATAIYDSIKNRILLFGGIELREGSSRIIYGNNTFNDIWELKLDGTEPEWNNITPSNSPTPRFGHTFVLDTTNNRGLLFGGVELREGSLALATNEVWSFDLQNDIWSVLNTNYPPPNPRMNHSSAYDSKSKMLYIFGGRSANYEQTFGDAFVLRLSGANPNWAQLANPASAPPPYPTTTSSAVTALYSNQTTKFYNPYFPEKSLSTDAKGCVDHGGESGCNRDSYSVVLDTKQKSQWIIGTIAKYSGGLYRPILTVQKRKIPVKLSCDN